MADTEASGPAPLVLGDGIVERARPRLGTSHRHWRPGAIGIVGRSTMGFGRIIAAAGSSRPRVTTDSLTTWSLRPPFPAWMPGHEAAEEASAPSSWTTRAVPSSSRRPAPAPPTTPPRPVVPPKVDALRRLLESQGMIEPSSASPAVEPHSRAAARSTGTDASPDDPPFAPDRTATSAGPTTAPGQLGRRTRPEAAPTEERIADVFPERPTEPGPIRRSPARPGGIDRFRSALESRGLIPSTASPDRSPDRSPDQPADRPRRDDTARRPRRAPPSESASGRGDAPNRDSTRHPEATTRPARDRVRDDGARPPSGPLATGDAPHRPTSPELSTAVADRATPLRFSLLPDVTSTIRRHAVTAIAPHEPIGVVTQYVPSRPAVVRPDAAAPLAGRHDPVATRRDERLRRPTPGEPTARATTPVMQHPGSSILAAADGVGVLLRQVGRRSGVAHNWSDRHRPETELSTRLRRRADPETVRAGEPSLRPDPTRSRIDTIGVAASATVRPGPASVSGDTSADGTLSPDPVARAGSPSPIRQRPGSLATLVARRRGPVRSPSDSTRPVPSSVAGRPSALQRALATEPRAASQVPSPAPASLRPRPGSNESARTTRSEPTRSEPAGPGSHESARAARPDPTRPDPTRPDPTRPDGPGRTSRTDPAQPGSGETKPAATKPATTNPAILARRPVAVEPVTIEPVAVEPLPVVAPTAGALAERFLAELRREPAAPPRDLPDVYRPLASAITGTASRVRISHDATSARALRSVGKRAATVGDVIHLQRAPDHDVRAAEVLAHELTHVAHPSPVPRFFDDDIRGPEERMAEQVAQVIARSPVTPSAPAPARRASHEAIRRRPAPAGPSRVRPTSGGTISAADLAASIEGRAPALRRAAEAGRSERHDGAGPAVIRRADADATDEQGGGGATSPFASPQAEREWFERMITQTSDYILRRIEDRVMIDFERRGGRLWRNL